LDFQGFDAVGLDLQGMDEVLMAVLLPAFSRVFPILVV
jgi:hypothetical protein